MKRTAYAIERWDAERQRYCGLDDWGIYVPEITSRATAEALLLAARQRGDRTDFRIVSTEVQR